MCGLNWLEHHKTFPLVMAAIAIHKMRETLLHYLHQHNAISAQEHDKNAN